MSPFRAYEDGYDGGAVHASTSSSRTSEAHDGDLHRKKLVVLNHFETRTIRRMNQASGECTRLSLVIRCVGRGLRAAH